MQALGKRSKSTQMRANVVRFRERAHSPPDETRVCTKRPSIQREIGKVVRQAGRRPSGRFVIISENGQGESPFEVLEHV